MGLPRINVGASLILSAIGLIGLSTGVSFADDAEISAADGEIQARSREDNALLWRVRASQRWSAEIASRRSGLIVTADGCVLDRRGRVCATFAEPVRGAVPTGRGGDDCPYWDALAEITPPPSGGSDAHAPLLVDSAGNVWVINTHIQSGDYSLQVRRSNGHDGGWGPLETISDTTNYVSQPEGAIDGDDNITIIFRDIAGGYRLYAIRHEPGTGWGPLTQVLISSAFFQAIEIATDAVGNVIGIIDPESGGDTVASVVYDAETETWGSAVEISPPGGNTLLPTIAQNRSGTAVFVVYIVRGGGEPGLYGNRWSPETKTWGPAQMLPGTADVGFGFAGPASRFPLVVGADGEATVFWQRIVEVEPDVFEFTVFASRTSGGIWQGPEELLPPGEHDTDIENFAHATTNDASDVMGVITRFEGAGSNRFWAFLRDAEGGWQDAMNPYTSGLAINTRCRVAFHQVRKAIGTVYGLQDSVAQLTSFRFSGQHWVDGLLDIPGTFVAFYQEIIADDNEAVLVFEAESGGNQGIKASWWRNMLGDLDCNDLVNVFDLLALLEQWGECPDPPADCPADVNGDGIVDVFDLLLLLGNWG